MMKNEKRGREGFFATRCRSGVPATSVLIGSRRYWFVGMLLAVELCHAGVGGMITASSSERSACHLSAGRFNLLTNVDRHCMRSACAVTLSEKQRAILPYCAAQAGWYGLGGGLILPGTALGLPEMRVGCTRWCANAPHRKSGLQLFGVLSLTDRLSTSAYLRSIAGPQRTLRWTLCYRFLSRQRVLGAGSQRLLQTVSEHAAQLPGGGELICIKNGEINRLASLPQPGSAKEVSVYIDASAPQRPLVLTGTGIGFGVNKVCKLHVPGAEVTLQSVTLAGMERLILSTNPLAPENFRAGKITVLGPLTFASDSPNSELVLETRSVHLGDTTITMPKLRVDADVVTYYGAKDKVDEAVLQVEKAFVN